VFAQTAGDGVDLRLCPVTGGEDGTGVAGGAVSAEGDEPANQGHVMDGKDAV